MRGWAWLGLLLFACVMPFTMRYRARNKLKDFSDKINAYRAEWDKFVADIIEGKNSRLPDKFADAKTELNLITRTHERVDMTSVNHNKQRS